jgi:hypothetical protein
MSNLLTIENAKAYCLSIVPDAAIVAAYEGAHDNGTFPFVKVDFTRPDSDWFYCMDVWVENGALYGEW